MKLTEEQLQQAAEIAIPDLSEKPVTFHTFACEHLRALQTL